MTILYQEVPKQTPANSNIRTPIMLSWRSRDAAPSGGGPRGGGPRGAAALMRRDGPRPSRIWHAPSAWRASCARRPLRRAGVRAVRRARPVRCARHGGPRRALPQHLLRVAVLDAAGRCRAERRCVGRCASPWTGRLGSRCSLLNAANSWPSRLRSTSQTITFVVLESISLSSLRCATGLCVHGR